MLDPATIMRWFTGFQPPWNVSLDAEIGLSWDEKIKQHLLSEAKNAKAAKAIHVGRSGGAGTGGDKDQSRSWQELAATPPIEVQRAELQLAGTLKTASGANKAKAIEAFQELKNHANPDQDGVYLNVAVGLDTAKREAAAPWNDVFSSRNAARLLGTLGNLAPRMLVTFDTIGKAFDCAKKIVDGLQGLKNASKATLKSALSVPRPVSL